MPITMQLAGAEILDTAAARSLVVEQPEDKPNLCMKHGSNGKGKPVLPMYSFRGTMEKKYQIPRISYEDIREHMSKKLKNGKRRILTETETKAVMDSG